MFEANIQVARNNRKAIVKIPSQITSCSQCPNSVWAHAWKVILHTADDAPFKPFIKYSTFIYATVKIWFSSHQFFTQNLFVILIINKKIWRNYSLCIAYCYFYSLTTCNYYSIVVVWCTLLAAHLGESLSMCHTFLSHFFLDFSVIKSSHISAL